MATTGTQNNNGTVIAVAVVVVIAVGVCAYLLLRPKTPPKVVKPNTPTPVSTQATSSTPGFPLSIGSSGQAVMALQQGLNQYQGVTIVVDGNFGAATAAACATAGFSLPINYNDFNEIIAPPDASNTATVSTSTSGGNALTSFLNDFSGLNQAPAGTTASVDQSGNVVYNAPQS